MTTQTTHPERDELWHILNDLAQYVHSASVVAKCHGAFVGGEPIREAKAKIEALILAHTAKAVEAAQLETFEFCIANFRSKAYILDKYNALKERQPHDPAI